MRIEGFQGGFLPLSGGGLTGGVTINGLPVYGRRAEVAGANAGIVTPTASMQTVVSLNLGNVSAGDRIRFYGWLTMSKGVTGGETRLQFVKVAGAAAITWAQQALTPKNGDELQGASTGCRFEVVGYAEVTGAGACTVEFQALSAGSNGTINVGDGFATAEVWGTG
jgi:hypothetical protein